ncbi:hypothetical protein [Streptomyces oceani]|uniref:hypothetical protein n=1 Tax=Streptomyces oceani TaxID=1075402 RepID=UPI0009A122D8|nr:hypothetical protein [Streptomyces oceani]
MSTTDQTTTVPLGGEHARLLPWPTPEGKPCYLVADGTGFLSEVADNYESVQLGMAIDLLGHVADLPTEDRATPEQLRYVIARLTESLCAVHRIARSRGARLPTPVRDDDYDAYGQADVEGAEERADPRSPLTTP